MNDPFDMTEIYAQQRRCEEQMLESKLRQIELDCIMQQFQAALMIQNFNMLSLVYASLNPNLSGDDLKRIFGNKLKA